MIRKWDDEMHILGSSLPHIGKIPIRHQGRQRRPVAWVLLPCTAFQQKVVNNLIQEADGEDMHAKNQGTAKLNAKINRDY